MKRLSEWRIIGYRDIEYLGISDCLSSNFWGILFGENILPHAENKEPTSLITSPWQILRWDDEAAQRVHKFHHPFEKQLKNISPYEGKVFSFVCARRGKAFGGEWASERGMQNFNEFLGRNVFPIFARSLSLYLSTFSNKCSQQGGTSDGFHVQIDKFSSVCINYAFSFSSEMLWKVGRGRNWVRKLSLSWLYKALFQHRRAEAKVLQSFFRFTERPHHTLFSNLSRGLLLLFRQLVRAFFGLNFSTPPSRRKLKKQKTSPVKSDLLQTFSLAPSK